MADEDLEVGISLDASDAIRDARAIASAFEDITRSTRELTVALKSLGTGADRAAQGFAATIRESKKYSPAIREASGSMSALTKAHREYLAEARAGMTGKSASAGYERLRQQADSARKSLDALNLVQKQSGRLYKQDEKRWANKQEVAEYAKALDQVTRAEQSLNKVRARKGTTMEPARPVGYQAWQDAQAAAAAGTAKMGQAASDAAPKVAKLNEHLFQSRFAYHDIAAATTAASAALIGSSALVIKAAADYETAMATIQRTAGVSDNAMVALRKDFIELAQTIPVGFDNLARIGELAGQLNIPTDRIDDFTGTIARFSSTTDVSVDSAAEAFGRLDALLPDVNGNYEALGSSILHVGVNSVATESAIISTTTQIAAAGAQARLSSDEIVGLAASYASLGIAPEAARGSTIRIFSEINTAVTEGGAALDSFAKISDMSASEFKQAWTSGDSSELFLDFLRGLKQEGTQAEAALRELGITGVRDINALLRLSQNVELVGETFGYAASGFQEGTQLGEAFGITADTLNARLQVMAQNFQALLAVLGSSSLGPLSGFLDIINGFLGFLADNSDNHIAGFIAGTTALFAILAGGTLVVTALMARMAAFRASILLVREQLVALSASADQATAALARTQAGALNGAIAMTKFSNAMKATGWALGVSLAISGVVAGISAIGEAAMSAEERAKRAFGDLSGLSNALAKDTEELRGRTEEALGTVEGAIYRTDKVQTSWAKNMEAAGLVADKLGDSVKEVSKKLGEQTFLIGENAAAWWGNALSQNPKIEQMFKRLSELYSNTSIELPELNTGGLITKMIANDTDAAMNILEQWEVSARDAINRGLVVESTEWVNSNALIQEVFNKTKDAIIEVSGAYSEATSEMERGQIISNAITTVFGDIADSASDLGEEMRSLADHINAAFGAMDTMTGWGDTIGRLFSTIGQYGPEVFWQLSAEGNAAVGDLTAAIEASINAGQVMGISASESVALLFMQLKKEGVETAQLLASLANIPGIDVSNVKAFMDGSDETRGAGKAMATMLNDVARAGSNAGRSLGNTGGGGSPGVAKAAKEAAKEIRTLSDYASDLRGVFDRAFDLRFGNQQALDDTTKKWLAMAEAIDQANQELEDAMMNIAGLSSDNASLEYFLSVAVEYGDTERANEIQQKIAENNAEIAKEQGNLDRAQAKLSKNTEGNTAANIEAREALLDLIQSYQNQLVVMAENGATQDQLKRKAAQFKQELIAQATQLGYTRQDVLKYTKTFDDLTRIIAKVPRNITTKFSASMTAADKAILEFRNKTAAAGKVAAQNYSRGWKSGIGTIQMPSMSTSWQRYSAEKTRLYNEYMYAATMYQQALNPYNPGKVSKWGSTMRSARLKWQNYWTGGYTGDGGTRQPAGVVHGKEYVIDAENTRRLGVPFLDALNAGKTPMATTTAMPSTMVVELSARDRALLAAAGNVTLTIDGKVVGQATNAANFGAGRRGSN